MGIAALLGLPSPLRAQPLVDHHQHFFDPGVDATQLVALLDAANIRRAVVLSQGYQPGNPNRPPVENERERVRAINDWTSREVARFPDRLIGFCGVNPLRDYALEEIARCAKDPRLRSGLKLHFGNSDVDLNNRAHVDRLRHVFQAANTNGMAIAVHLRSSVNQKRPYGANEAKIFLDQIIPAAPDVIVQIAHLAGAGGYDDPTVDEAVSVLSAAVAAKDRRMARVFIDISGIWLENWTAHLDLMARRIRELGVERILYGSDGAAGGNLPPREAWAAFRKLPLSEAEFAAIAGNVAPYLK
jgi:predicted TIM-barrel fold metal-dependent hydrolase